MVLLLRGVVLVLWTGLSPPTVLLPAADDATRVLTDTPAYCVQLQDMIEDLVRNSPAPPPWGVALLTEEGERLCAQGLVRGGLTRLRRALIMLREAQGPGGG